MVADQSASAGREGAKPRQPAASHLLGRVAGNYYSPRRGLLVHAAPARVVLVQLSVYINRVPTTKPTAKKPRGRGRPPLEAGVATVPVMIRMTSPQKEKLVRLGGPGWVRTKIDKAREPEK